MLFFGSLVFVLIISIFCRYGARERIPHASLRCSKIVNGLMLERSSKTGLILERCSKIANGLILERCCEIAKGLRCCKNCEWQDPPHTMQQLTT